MFAKCQILMGKLDCIIPLKKEKKKQKITVQQVQHYSRWTPNVIPSTKTSGFGGGGLLAFELLLV